MPCSVSVWLREGLDTAHPLKNAQNSESPRHPFPPLFTLEPCPRCHPGRRDVRHDPNSANTASRTG